MVKRGYRNIHKKNDLWISLRRIGAIYIVWNNTYEWKHSIQFFHPSNWGMPKLAILWRFHGHYLSLL